MLRWSSTKAGSPADLAALADGRGDAGLAHGRELVAFAEAIGGDDEQTLASARDALVAAAGAEFMVDAAAVAANFEMMTRVADGTGARFPADPTGGRAALASSLGITGFTSAR
jgi:hypothetical protein